MTEHPLQATIMDVVPLGERLLLSVQGLGRRPALPAGGRILQTGQELTLLDQPHSPSMWLLSQVTLLAEAPREANWRAWTGKTLLISEVEAL